MTALFTQLLSWKAILVAIGVFGFAPGAVLRLIILLYPRSDPSRRELLSDLHKVPRWERPFWVAEQLESAIVLGLAPRAARGWRRVAPGRRTASWWRREKASFWSGRYTTGYALTTYSFFTTVVYVVLLVPGIGKVIGFAAWAVLGLVMARLHERDRKRLGPEPPLPATTLDRRFFTIAGPVVYAVTFYMLVHNVAELAGGHVAAPGYWIGVYLCFMLLVYPWELLRLGMRATLREAGIGPAGQPGE